MGLLKIDQALTSAVISGDFGLPIVHENSPAYTPINGKPYLEIIINQNDVTPYSLASTDITDGVLTIFVRYPDAGGAIACKTKCDAILSVFRIGARIGYDGQFLTVTKAARRTGVSEPGWYKQVITIFYKSFLPR